MESNGLRTFIAIVLCMGVILVWQMFLSPKPQPRPASQAAITADAGVQAPQAPAAQQTVETVKAQVPGPAKKPEAPERLETVEGPLWKAVFSTRGGALRSFELKKYRLSEKNPAPMNLVKPLPDSPLPLSSRILFAGAQPDFEPSSAFEVAGRDPGSISFRRRSQGIEVVKTYRYATDQYIMTLETTVANATPGRITAKPGIVWDGAYEKFVKSSSWFAPSGPDNVQVPACLANDEVRKVDPEKRERIAVDGMVEWAGDDSRYFLAAILPQGVLKSSCELSMGDGSLGVLVEYPEIQIDQGASKSFSYRVYAGPKDYWIMRGLERGLDRSVDYGWLTVLCVPMLWLLRLFHSFIGNWGVAIIILTILVKVISLPLTSKSYKSMQAMAKLKPKLDELQKKYKDDRQKLNEEMLKLYQTHGVSPLSGCLPMLLQMPIWIALYRMLYSAGELYQSHFIPGWINNLADKDPYYILPVLMGAGMFLQQKMTPQTMDSTQAKMMLYFMPVFFTLLMLQLPAGLTLYIFVNTILSIGQQYYNNRTAEQSRA